MKVDYIKKVPTEITNEKLKHNQLVHITGVLKSIKRDIEAYTVRLHAAEEEVKHAKHLIEKSNLRLKELEKDRDDVLALKFS